MNAPMNTQFVKHRESSRGSVLIIVMVVCIGLVSLALVFGHSMAMAYRGSVSDLAGRQSQRAIDGAVQYVEYLMIVSGSNAATSGSSSAASSGTSGSGTMPATYLLPDPTTYQSEAVPVGGATFWFIGEPGVSSGNASTNGLASSTSNSLANSSSTPTFGLIDEASKLNLNTATVAMLENLPNMTPSLAQAIVTWRTSGTSAAATSGTSSSSSSSASSGVTKGGPFESIYELAQVAAADGDDPTILTGNDTNLNHIMDSNESQGISQYTPGIYEYVTVFSREPNIIPSTGAPRINVITGSAAGNSTATGVTGESLASSASSATTLNGLLTSVLGETRGRQVAGAARAGGPVTSVLQFYVNSGMTAAELDEVTPFLTMSSGSYKTGLINVNTASATVLACVPGITPAMASQIVSTRQAQSTPYTNLAWLVPILGNQVAIQAGPYLTTASYQVTADVAAVGPNGLGYRRTLFVIDGSNGTPEVVYRHNMTPLGWALGPNAMQSAGKQNTTMQ
jgi:DNA uptake protein ComE-like DNA-binding protein